MLICRRVEAIKIFFSNFCLLNCYFKNLHYQPPVAPIGVLSNFDITAVIFAFIVIWDAVLVSPRPYQIVHGMAVRAAGQPQPVLSVSPRSLA